MFRVVGTEFRDDQIGGMAHANQRTNGTITFTTLHGCELFSGNITGTTKTFSGQRSPIARQLRFELRPSGIGLPVIIREGARHLHPSRRHRSEDCCLACSSSGLVPKSQLSQQFQAFSQGDWRTLFDESEGHASTALKSRSRRRRRNQSAEQDLERRAARAESLVHTGELSAARLALEGDSVAPGDDATLSALRDPERRPPVLRDPIPEDILSSRPEVPLDLDSDILARNIRSARRGAAGGPSGMTMDHIRPLLESEADTAGFSRMCLDFARAEIPSDVLTLLKMGTVTALRKPNGKIRGIIIGDIMRRVVARTIAEQVVLAVEEATAPFQYALSTKG